MRRLDLPDAAPAAGAVRGRIEHVASGLAGTFESIEELVAFLAALVTVPED